MFAVKVGDEVGYARSARMGYMSAGFSTVTKVNGHGHIILENGKTFDKRGNERNTNYGGLFLIQAANLREAQARDNAERERVSRAKALQQKVQDLFGYSGNVHVTAERKAELMALVEAL